MLNGFADPATIEARLAELCNRWACTPNTTAPTCASRSRSPTLVRAATQVFGALDILVNNAVVRFFGAVENFAPEHWDEALAVNLSAPFHTIRLALPGMKAKGWGRIVNMASVYSTLRHNRPRGLHHHQDRLARADPRGRAGMRPHRRHLQRDLPRHRADPGDRTAAAQ